MVNNLQILKNHSEIIQRELVWFRQILETRLQLHLSKESPYKTIWEIAPPEYETNSSSYVHFIRHHSCSPAERILLMLALAPHAEPGLLDGLCTRDASAGKPFSLFGGQKGTTHGGFLPTGETALFLLAGSDLHSRTLAAGFFDPGHYLMAHHILQLGDAGAGEPPLSGALGISLDHVHCFLSGQYRRPVFSKDFPARLISSPLDWEDLVLPPDTRSHLEELQAWIRHRDVLMNDWGFSRKLKPGYKCLFYGPPGTGKSSVACVIGKCCNLDVYRIDLSMLVSKYVGETEKNLEKVFQQAENKQWILFFDEADALFGKRSAAGDAQDRYANQETSYLLQRIEDFSGVVILATNLKNNIDEAFARRFKSLVYFPIPQPEERLKLWQRSFSASTVLEDKMDLPALAQRHELTGGMILNVTSYCSLMALERRENVIRLADAERGIQKEFAKEGRIM